MNIHQQRRLMTMAYIAMFLALFTVVTGIFAYFMAAKVANAEGTEVWIQAQALWVIRNITLCAMVAGFGGLWFIPLCFYTWNTSQWITGMTIVGIIFGFMAWVALLNAFVKGFIKYLKHKAVF